MASSTPGNPRGNIRASCVQSLSVSDSYISATVGQIRGLPAAEPMLQISFNIEAGGLSDGTSAMFFASAHLQADGGGTVILAQATPVVSHLGFRPQHGRDKPYQPPAPLHCT